MANKAALRVKTADGKWTSIPALVVPGGATDEQAAEVPVLYPEWREDMEFEVGKRVRRGGVMYRVLNKHKGHRDHMPENDGDYFERIEKKNHGHRPRAAEE